MIQTMRRNWFFRIADGWNRIASSDDSETPYIMTFNYGDFTDVVSDPTAQNDLFVSATMSGLTAYGLYAVPKGDV